MPSTKIFETFANLVLENVQELYIEQFGIDLSYSKCRARALPRRHSIPGRSYTI
jgi:hypothetical protein